MRIDCKKTTQLGVYTANVVQYLLYNDEKYMNILQITFPSFYHLAFQKAMLSKLVDDFFHLFELAITTLICLGNEKIFNFFHIEKCLSVTRNVNTHHFCLLVKGCVYDIHRLKYCFNFISINYI